MENTEFFLPLPEGISYDEWAKSLVAVLQRRLESLEQQTIIVSDEEPPGEYPQGTFWYSKSSRQLHIYEDDGTTLAWVLANVRSQRTVEVTVSHADVASAAQKILIPTPAGTQWKLREIFLSGDGTNFSGGGDRALDIEDESGSIIYSTIPAGTLQSLAPARWGDAGVPWPTVASDLFAPCTVGENIVAAYSGGSTDYSAGSLKLFLTFERSD